MTASKVILALLLAPLLLLAGLLGLAVQSDTAAQAAAGDGCTGTPAGPAHLLPLQPAIGGYGTIQLGNAVAILNAAVPLGVPAQGQRIAVMTAMGESALVNLGAGDAAGPDSRGVFQQRAAGWGSLADRMDPAKAAAAFYRALLAVPGWQAMPPTLAAHRVQGNADPYYYAQFWAPAGDVVAALTGAPPVGGTGATVCSPTPLPTPTGIAGWTRPAVGVLSSGFSSRVNPVTGGLEHHNGQDIANACGTPIVAADAGTVISSGPASGFGNWIRIDHGGGIVTVYGHMKAVDLLVRVGDRVAAGQQISRIGSEGQSTGCHLHFEVHVDGVPVDPVPWMAAQGVRL